CARPSATLEIAKYRKEMSRAPDEWRCGNQPRGGRSRSRAPEIYRDGTFLPRRSAQSGIYLTYCETASYGAAERGTVGAGARSRTEFRLLYDTTIDARDQPVSFGEHCLRRQG